MAGDLILAIDQGTTNSKAMLVDIGGAITGSASDRVTLRYPRPGWVESDGRDLWTSVQAAVRSCLAGTDPARIAALAVTNQRESVLAWNRGTGEPLGPCISWQCRRTADACDALRDAGRGDWLFERTGLAIDPLFSATKARWLLDVIEEAPARIRRGELCVGTIDAWLVWNLTGGATFATDITNASRTQLLDLRGRRWDDELAAVFGVPLSVLPEIRGSSAIVGETRGSGPIPAGLPIASMIGDSHGALFGHGVPRVGEVKATFGTGSSVMTPTDADVRVDGLAATIAWGIEGSGGPAAIDVAYALEGNITATGAALEWLAAILGLEGQVPELESLAASTPETGGVYLVPAFAGLGAPHWDSEARGLISGLTGGTTRAHLARAAFESIAFQIRDVVEVLRANLPAPPTVLLADGGAIQSDLLARLQSDALGIPLLRSGSSDGSGLGAAYLAGLAIGWWGSLDEIRGLPRAVERFEPGTGSDAAEQGYRGWREAVQRAAGRPAPVRAQSVGT